MKTRIVMTFCLLAAAMFSACTQQEDIISEIPDARPALCDFTINASVAPMQAVGSGTSSRSLGPMGPEDENPVKSLAIIQFDSEGNLLQINKTAGNPYYHYRDFTDEGKLPGSLSPELEGVTLYPMSDTRVCFIGNMDEESIQKLIYNEANTPVGWSDFQNKTVEIEYDTDIYKEDGITINDDIGHVNQIYLFGYYEGDLSGSSAPDDGTAASQMSVVLSRLIARLEIGISLREGVELGNNQIYFRLKNVEKEAYLFLDVDRESYEHDHIEVVTTNRTQNIKEGHGIFYFYVAPHLVKYDKRENATRILLWCVENAVTDPEKELDEKDAYEVLLCNDPMEESPTAAGAYWINRNSVYHVQLTLTYEDQSRQTGAPWGVKQADGSYHYTVNMKKN